MGATHYSTAVDMWSVGCIFGILLFRHASYIINFAYCVVSSTMVMNLQFCLFPILAELVTKQALFAGDSELQQLLHIFRFLRYDMVFAVLLCASFLAIINLYRLLGNSLQVIWR